MKTFRDTGQVRLEDARLEESKVLDTKTFKVRFGGPGLARCHVEGGGSRGHTSIIG